jgi:hypothetical protein
MVINFNYNPETHLAEDQHVIRIKSAKKTTEGGGARVEKVGTPGTAKSVSIPPDWEDFRPVQDILVPSKERTTAHEMGHDVNVSHHGEEDIIENWYLSNSGKLVAQEVAYNEGTGQYGRTNDVLTE